MNLYQQRVLEARKEFLKLNKAQEKELLSIYKELAKQISDEIVSCRTTSSKQYLSGMEEIVQAYMNELNIKLNKTIKGNIKASSQIASSTSLAYYEGITDNIKLRSMFNKSVINASANTVKKLIQGKYYTDGKTLDKRIWDVTRKNAKDIDILIKVNVARGANARTLGKQLNKYINPLKRTEAKTIVSGMSSKVSYQAQRLARTSVTHSFSETIIENAKTNPFNKGVKWNLSSSHYERQVKRHGSDICDDYAGKVFIPNEIPLQHPNCLCYFTEENENIDKVINELKEWGNGENNPKLDKWLEDYGKEFGIEKNNKGFTDLNTFNKVNSGIINNKKNNYSFEKILPHVLKKYGVTFERFNEVRLKDALELTSGEVELIKNIRRESYITQNTVMQKVVHRNSEWLFNKTEGQIKIGGFVTKSCDTKDLTTFDEIYEGLRLDYSWEENGKIIESDFTHDKNSNNKSILLIRFKATNKNDYKIPFGGTTDEAVEKMTKNDINKDYVAYKADYPYSGNGFTKSKEKIIPEVLKSRKQLHTGDELYELIENNIKLIAVYNEDEQCFVKLK